MKILMVNKFLYPNGGSETYIFKLGEQLQKAGHEVQFFGMEHKGRIVGNRVNAYTADMDFHGGSKLAKLMYPVKTIYSADARRKIRKVLEDFQPDVCHLNNFNYQLTPSIILEIKKWSRQTGHTCRIVYTAHDYQLVCPNHMCNNPTSHVNCEKCLHGGFIHCTKGKCIHGSTLKSMVGTVEALLWNAAGVYKHIDTVICCSHFMKTKLDTNPVFAGKTIVMHNFVDQIDREQAEKKDYVLYFGRYSQEKGIRTLAEACKHLPEIPFVFAGSGPLKEQLQAISNVKEVGFQTGEELKKLISEAQFTVYPSEWYENCPFSVMESQMYGTRVLGADIGGIPELIQAGKTGELFESGNREELEQKIRQMWAERHSSAQQTMEKTKFDSVEEYAEKVMKVYANSVA